MDDHRAEPWIFAAYFVGGLATAGGNLLHAFIPPLQVLALISHGIGGTISVLIAWWLSSRVSPLYRAHCVNLRYAWIYGHLLPSLLIALSLGMTALNVAYHRPVYDGYSLIYIIAQGLLFLSLAIWHIVYLVRGVLRLNARRAF
jgi:hypothetical protein